MGQQPAIAIKHVEVGGGAQCGVLHWTRVPGTGPQAEHWSHPQTAPGRKRAEACVHLTCVVSRCMAAMSAGCGSGGGGRTGDRTRYRTACRNPGLCRALHTGGTGSRRVCTVHAQHQGIYLLGGSLDCWSWYRASCFTGGGGRGQSPFSAEGKGHQSKSRGHAATEHCESISVRHGG